MGWDGRWESSGMGKGWWTVFMGAEGGLCLEINDGKDFIIRILAFYRVSDIVGGHLTIVKKRRGYFSVFISRAIG